MLKHKSSISAIALVSTTTGCIFHIVAEKSLFPLAIAFTYYILGILIFFMPKIGGTWERRVYTQVFSVGFLAAGMSALYRTFANDLVIDASFFYEMSSQDLAGYTLNEIQTNFGYALPIFIFNHAFHFATMIGFPQAQYIVIFINVLIVAYSGVVALKIAEITYGYDPYRFKRLALIFSTCGLFLVYSGLLLRDAFVLLGVTVLVYAWVYFLNRPNFHTKLIFIVIISLISEFYFGFVRPEFSLVPMAFVVMALIALFIASNNKSNLIIFGFFFVIMIIFSLNYSEIILSSLTTSREKYYVASINESSNKSLGVNLILNQPIPIRMFLGTIFLFIFPIPFWAGIELGSVYFLLKSINAIFFYFLIPLIGLSIIQILKDASARRPVMLFLLLISIMSSLALSISSGETRHHGSFFVPLFILAILPDLRILSAWNLYKKLYFFTSMSVFFIHIAWFFLKAS